MAHGAIAFQYPILDSTSLLCVKECLLLFMMANLIFSDSDSDLEVLMMLSDWDSDESIERSPISSPNGELAQFSSTPEEVEQSNQAHPDEDWDDIVSSRPNNGLVLVQQRNDIAAAGEGSVQPQNTNGSANAPARGRKRRISRRFRNVERMQYLNDTDFTYRFRLSKAAVEALLTEIMPHVQVTSRRNNGVAPLHQLLLTLRFYALGAMLESIADSVGVSKSSACRIVQGISGAIAKLYDKHVVWQQDNAINYFKIAQFPRVLGVIDCTHVRIQSPNHLFGDEFKNREGFFSLNVQVVCDSDLRLMNVDARWAGSIDDDTIFDNSAIRAECENGAFGNRWLLGDSAYPCRAYLLTPILNPTTKNELKYNEAHFKTWDTIQRTISAWKRRFPVLAFTLRLKLRNIQNVIISTAVLHNFCIDYKLEDIPTEVSLPQDTPQNVGPQNMEVQDFGHRADLVENYFN